MNADKETLCNLPKVNDSEEIRFDSSIKVDDTLGNREWIGNHDWIERHRVACEYHRSIVEETLSAAGILSSGRTLADFMQTNRLADSEESVFNVFLRATKFLADAGSCFYGSEAAQMQHQKFLEHVCNFEIILGSPILTNAGRRKKSISACSIPPVKLSKMSTDEIAKLVGDYHTKGMGTGFCLDDVSDPATMVKTLNQIAIAEVQRGEIERSCGNMGVLSIGHPKVMEFIRVKTNHPEIKEWKFNLSVNLSDNFIESLTSNRPFALEDGSFIDPWELMTQVAKDAHATGDPGLIFMDRINKLNKVPQLGHYKTVVPCGETSLFDGEVCQFSYINLAKFVNLASLNEREGCSTLLDQALSIVDRDRLRDVIHQMITLLDNAVEANTCLMPNEQSASIIAKLRRVGIGVCGFSEMLQAAGLSYDSEEGRKFARCLMSFINYESKRASIELAKTRGPFALFNHEETRKELFIAPFKEKPTQFVSRQEWEELEEHFNRFGIRNLSTTILPPSGRSSLLAGVTASIEPPFRLVADRHLKSALARKCLQEGFQGDLDSVLEIVKRTGSLATCALPSTVKNVFKAALEIHPEDHVRMTAAFQTFTDEGISKTVNLPSTATVQDVVSIYTLSHKLGLKGVTIYRDGCRNFQPKALNTTALNTKALNMQSNELTTLIDPIYGPTKISPRLAKLLETPLLKRLQGIHQNGSNYLIDPRQTTTRYEHSVGAMVLAQKLGGDETAQAAALLHDISHTAFSHVADLVFENKEQNFHDLCREEFFASELAAKSLADLNVSQLEMECEKIPLVKGKSLNVDRLDYCIRDLLKVNRIYHPQYSSILNNLVLCEDGELRCKNMDTARLIFQKFLEVNQEVYFNPKAEVATKVLSWILKQMLSRDELSLSDLFKTDKHIEGLIQQSPFAPLFKEITPQIQFSKSNSEAAHTVVHRKLRYIDPQIIGFEGKLTDHCPQSRDLLHHYQKLPTTAAYHIPALQKFIETSGL